LPAASALRQELSQQTRELSAAGCSEVCEKRNGSFLTPRSPRLEVGMQTVNRSDELVSSIA